MVLVGGAFDHSGIGWVTVMKWLAALLAIISFPLLAWSSWRDARAFLVVIGALWLIIIIVCVGLPAAQHPRCTFDRNEPGPQGWWWEIYKCSDGTSRRMLVAGQRG